MGGGGGGGVVFLPDCGSVTDIDPNSTTNGTLSIGDCTITALTGRPGESISGHIAFQRWRHSLVWTGSKMVVWGGDRAGVLVLNTGGIYDPRADPTP